MYTNITSSHSSQHLERLTVDQNKQLCKAIKARHTGVKKDLMDRLLEHPQTSKYASEEKYCGINVDTLKNMCRERNLQVSGVKFDLVLRILHNDNDSTPNGSTLKRAATDVITTVDASGRVTEKHVPKKRKKAAPSASKIYTRVDKKIESCKQKKYQSHWGSKTHSTEVYDLVGSILSSDIIGSEEDYLNKKIRFALTIAESACTSLSDNFCKMNRPGYDDFGGWSTIDSSLRTIADKARPVLSVGEREKMAKWIEDLHNTADPYGLTMDTNLLQTVEFLRGNDEQKSKESSSFVAAPAVASVVAVKSSGTEETPAAVGQIVNENVVNPGV